MRKKPVIYHRDEKPSIIAGDKCTLTELFHPDKDAVELDYSLAYAFVEAGGRTLDHYLQESEVYYIIKGQGTMYLDGEPHPVREGSTYYIPPQCNQWLQNNGDDRIEFLVIVNPPWREDTETVLED